MFKYLGLPILQMSICILATDKNIIYQRWLEKIVHADGSGIIHAADVI
jgi:hypothetical protein